MSTVSTTRVFVEGPSSGRSSTSKKGGDRRKIQLPGFNQGGTGAPPFISIPPRKKHRALLREREVFFARLQRERDMRTEIEVWAATRIQAIARGFLGRPAGGAGGGGRAPTPEVFPTPAEVLKQQLLELTAETDRQLRRDWADVDGEMAWRDSVARRAEERKNKRRRKLMQVSAAVTTQRIVRSFLARRAYQSFLKRLMRELRVDSALKIQKTMRGRIARVRVGHVLYDRAHTAAILIQRIARGVLRREHVKFLRMRMRCVEREEGSAILLQKLFRIGNAQRRVRRIKQDGAACTLQTLQRGRQARRRLYLEKVKREKAATRIQNLHRAREARDRVDAIRELKMMEEARAAAVKIQCAQRTRVAAKGTEVKRQARRVKAVETIQGATRMRAARNELGQRQTAAEQKKASTAIQAAVRGRRDRMVVAEKLEVLRLAEEARAQQAASVRIQAASRGLHGRRRASAAAKLRAEEREQKRKEAHAEKMRVEAMLREQSAVRIQAGIRGARCVNA